MDAGRAFDLLGSEMRGQTGGSPTSTGGPLKPGFGLSGAVLQLDKILPPLVLVFLPSIPTRSPPAFTDGCVVAKTAPLPP